MKIVGVLVVFFSLSVSLLKAGTVYLIANKPEVHGKLTLTGAAIHVDGSSAPDINLPDVLEADLDDGNFHLDYFSSSETPGDQLPPRWKGQDIGRVDVPGTGAYAKGTFTISGNGRAITSAGDRYYYLGRPWTGNGVWTVHVKDITTAEVGLMLRENLDPGAAMFGFGTGPVRVDSGANGLRHNRFNAGEGAQWTAINVDLPFWLRVSRSSDTFDIAVSSDGTKWGNVEHYGMKFPPSFQAGLFIDGGGEDVVGNALVDHVLFTPPPAEPEMLPVGVLLLDGTILAGSFGSLDPTGGTFNYMGKIIPIAPAQVASVMLAPVTMHELAKVDAQTGILLKNDDFVASDLQLVQGTNCDMNSVALGVLNYNSGNALACVLRAVKPLPSTYEVRLKDGSSIRASGISVDNGQVLINDVSGIAVTANASEVAQVRAGPALVQTLIDLPWKATPVSVRAPVPVAIEAPAPPATNAVTAPTPPAATTNIAPAVTAPPAPTGTNAVTAPTPPAAATNVAPAATAPAAPTTNDVTTATPPAAATTNVAPAAKGPPATNAVTTATPPAAAAAPVTDDIPSVRCWQGNNQEQIMAVMRGTSIDFPLTGKFRALALKVALSPDAPPDAQATVRILADGEEVGRTPAIKAGDPPRFVQFLLHSPKKVTLVADTVLAGTKVLYIDPVAVRQ